MSCNKKIPEFKNMYATNISKTHGTPITFDDWYSENEDVLLDIWYDLQSSVSVRNIFILDRCRFDNFCSFVSSNTTFE